MTAQRLSRIVLFNRFFDYPLRAGNVLRNLPFRVLVRAFVDYVWVRFTERTRLSKHSDDNFEGWVVKRFGRTLYRPVLRALHGEGVEDAAAPRSRADWASQRIIPAEPVATRSRKTLFRPLKGQSPRTLVTAFLYPAHGGIGELARGYVAPSSRVAARSSRAPRCSGEPEWRPRDQRALRRR